MIAIVDYGVGNVASVARAVERAGFKTSLTSNQVELEAADWILLPGVGAFASAMERLHQQGLVSVLEELVLRKKKNFLGVCVGMQLLATTGYEDGETPGLGWIPGEVHRIPDFGIRIPHMGWNDLKVEKAESYKDVKDLNFVFMHSYHLIPQDPTIITATVDYGKPLVASIHAGNIHGAQFHPEKSQEAGIGFLRATFGATC